MALEVTSRAFYLGPRGSGAPWHFHVPAWNALYHGAKHWFLRPPSAAIYSKEAIGSWLERDYATGSQLECIQLGGDAMLLPDGWGHATLNLEASIGVTWELNLLGTGLQFEHPWSTPTY